MIWNKLKQELDAVQPDKAAVYLTAERMKAAANEGHRGHSLVWKASLSVAMVVVILCAGVFGINPLKNAFSPESSVAGGSETVSANKPLFTLMAYAAEGGVMDETGKLNENSEKLALEPNVNIVFPENINVKKIKRGFWNFTLTSSLIEKDDFDLNYASAGKMVFFGSTSTFRCEGENLKSVTFEAEDAVMTHFDHTYFEELKAQGRFGGGFSTVLSSSGDELGNFFGLNMEIFELELSTDGSWTDLNQKPVSREITDRLFKIGKKITGGPNGFYSWNWNFPKNYWDNADKTGDYSNSGITVLVTAEANDGGISKQKVTLSIDKDGNVSAKTENVK